MWFILSSADTSISLVLAAPQVVVRAAVLQVPPSQISAMAQAAAIPSDGLEHTGRAGLAGDSTRDEYETQYERQNVRETEKWRGWRAAALCH